MSEDACCVIIYAAEVEKERGRFMPVLSKQPKFACNLFLIIGLRDDRGGQAVDLVARFEPENAVLRSLVKVLKAPAVVFNFINDRQTRIPRNGCHDDNDGAVDLSKQNRLKFSAR